MEGPPGFGSYAGRGSGYGSAPIDQLKASFHDHEKNRARVSIAAILICLFVPFIQFAVAGAVLSFSMHYTHPGWSWFLVVLCGIATVLSWCLAFSAFRKRWLGDTARQPFWYIFLAATMVVSLVLGIWLGQINFRNNTVPANEIGELSYKYNVDPATTSGQQVMDAGRVMFTEGSHLDTGLSVGFRNTYTYCVAPIVSGNNTMDSYDYWAVGLDCCTNGVFRCGDATSGEAHAGMRLMRQGQREFYQLAVQQAEANYRIRAEHPLFFFWMQNPAAELQAYKDDAERHYLLGLLCYFCGQLFLVVLSLLCYSKI